jgi:hypothetical protein
MDVLLAERLLLRPKRREGEHHGGHWLRAAHANGLREPRWLLDPEATRAQAVVRVCPLCLDEANGIWREDWLNGQQAWCELHRVWLVDRCEACGRALRWSRVGFNQCGCGSGLREVSAQPLSLTVEAAIGEVPVTVLMWLGALSRYGPAGKPLKRASRRTLVEVIELIDRGAVLVRDWPNAFFSLLDDHRLRAVAGGEGSVQLLNEALPGLKRCICRLRDRRWQSEVEDALATYVASSLQTAAPLVGRNVPESRQQSVMQIARSLGVRSERLSVALDKLSGVGVAKRRTVGGRSRRIASPAAVAAAKTLLTAEITIKEAARMLSMTPARVHWLIVDHKLHKRSGRLDRGAVTELRDSLIRCAVTALVPVDAVPFEHALRYWIPVDRTGALFDELQSGKLTVYGHQSEGRSETLMLSQSQLCEWVATQPAADRGWLTIPEVAEHLALKQEVAYHLVRVGLISTETMRAARRATRVVPRQSLHDFEARFEPLVRAAARAGVDRRGGLEWAKARSMVLVSGPQIDGGRQYFVRLDRADATGTPFDAPV